MANILRHLATYPEPEVAAALGANVRHLCWMYEHYSLPFEGAGFGKLNVVLNSGPEEDLVPRADPFGWTAEVRTTFDAAAFGTLADPEQQRYYVERLHCAVLRCVHHFGWDQRHFDAARERMLSDGLRLAFWWKRRLSSPDRRIRAQGFVEAGSEANLWLVFSDRQGAELHRCLLAVTPCGSGVPRQVFGRLQWVDDATVRVVQSNGRDYWLCHVSGEAEFHYPRAEQGNAHGLYDLGRMYYEGGLLPPDRERGVLLIKAAASKGNRHAQQYLTRLERGEALPGDGRTPSE